METSDVSKEDCAEMAEGGSREGIGEASRVGRSGGEEAE